MISRLKWLWPERLPTVDKLGIIAGLIFVGCLVAAVILMRAAWYLPLIMLVCTALATWIFMVQDDPDEIEEIGDGIRDVATRVEGQARAMTADAKAAWYDAVEAARAAIRRGDQPPPMPPKAPPA